MCGIVGFTGGDKNLVRRMNQTIVHRGPDGVGYYTDKNVSLGNRRLAIIDLDKRSNQPMSTADGTIVITYNGEIYNFRELRQDLEKKGYRFVTTSDTEVILAMYQEYGFNCIHHFLGMFAFCIYDSQKNILFLARDHLGVKPLYYIFRNGQLFFASEINALLACDHLSFTLNTEAIYQTMRFRYPPFEDTFFSEIKKLKPGHYMVLFDHKLYVKKYWDIKQDLTSQSESSFSQQFLDVMHRSVNYHKIADTKVGCFLSGGIDSSLVTALLSKDNPDHVQAFSAQFDFFSEAPYARLLSTFSNIDHTIVDVTEKDALRALDTLFSLYEEPVTELASIPTLLLSQAARKHDIKVVLSGDGGDEMFGGYDHYFRLQRLHRLSRYLSKLRPLRRSSLLPLKAKRVLEAMDKVQDPASAYLYMNRAFTQQEIDGLLSFPTNEQQLMQRVGAGLNETVTDFLNQILYLDIKHQLAEYFLMKLDKATMAASLEARVPYVSKEVAAFAYSIPPSLKFKGHVLKYLVKKSARSILPKEILQRKKHGYGVPLFAWMKSEIGEVVRQKLDGNAFIFREGFINREKARSFITTMNTDEHAANRAWHLFALEQWFAQYHDRVGL